MFNPAMLMKMGQLKGKFEDFQRAHPKFMEFFVREFAQKGMPEGAVFEIKVTRPDGTECVTNMKVRQEDIELFEAIKKMNM